MIGRARHSTRPRCAVTAAEAARFVELRALGRTPKEIAAECERHVETVRTLLRLGWSEFEARRIGRADAARGSRPAARRPKNAISEAEASEIFTLAALDVSPKVIAARLGRHVETVRGVLRLGLAGWRSRHQRALPAPDQLVAASNDNGLDDALDTADYLTVRESVCVKR